MCLLLNYIAITYIESYINYNFKLLNPTLYLGYVAGFSLCLPQCFSSLGNIV